MEKRKAIVITGANRGIGLGLAEALLKLGSSFDLVLTSRNESDASGLLAHLQSRFPSYSGSLRTELLDISQSSSIDSFFSVFRSSGTKIDILINNSGVNQKDKMAPLDSATLDEVFSVNVHGTIEMCEKALEFLNDSGKIINLSSNLGRASNLKGEALRRRLMDKDLSKSVLMEEVFLFQEQLRKNNKEECQWDLNAYPNSKLIINFYSRLLSQEKRIKERNIQVYSVSPGWIRTDMGGPNATRSVEEGVVGIVYLVNLPHEIKEEFQGKFFYDSKVLDFSEEYTPMNKDWRNH